MSDIPEHILKYLWDVDKKKLDKEKHANFIIEKILEYGDTKALRWIEKNYKKDQIVKVLNKSKRISPKTGNFYASYFKINRKELECIKKPFTQKQNRF